MKSGISKHYNLHKVKKENLIAAIEYWDDLVKELTKRIEIKDAQIEQLLKDAIDLRVENCEDLKAATREVYELIYNEGYDEDYPNDNLLSKLPDECLTDQEKEEVFERDLDRHILNDPIANQSYGDLIHYELKEGVINHEKR